MLDPNTLNAWTAAVAETYKEAAVPAPDPTAAAWALAKEAGLKEILAVGGKAIERGRGAFNASRPTEGVVAGVGHALGGAKNTVAEALGGAQKADGAFSLRGGLKATAGEIAKKPGVRTAVGAGVGVASGIGIMDLLRKAFTPQQEQIAAHGDSAVKAAAAWAKEAKSKATQAASLVRKVIAPAQKGVGLSPKSTKPVGSLAAYGENATKGSKPLLSPAEIKALPKVSKPTVPPTGPAATPPSVPPTSPAAAPEAVPFVDGLKNRFNGLSGRGQHRVMAGGAAALTGAGMAGGALMGHGAGLKEGAGLGFDAGQQAGAQQASIDPGIMGRLSEVFMGRQAQAPTAVTGDRRNAIIQQILARQ